MLYSLLAIATGSIFSWLLGNSLTKRISSVIQATKQINPQTKSQIFTDIKKDEIGDLMVNFNQMEMKIQQQFEEIQNIAHKDALTGLYNRAYFESAMLKTQAEIFNNHNTAALVFVDISRSQILNDTYGHDTGDMLLKEIVRRIKAFIKESNVAFRIGGDEFLIIFNNIP